MINMMTINSENYYYEFVLNGMQSIINPSSQEFIIFYRLLKSVVSKSKDDMFIEYEKPVARIGNLSLNSKNTILIDLTCASYIIDELNIYNTKSISYSNLVRRILSMVNIDEFTEKVRAIVNNQFDGDVVINHTDIDLIKYLNIIGNIELNYGKPSCITINYKKNIQNELKQYIDANNTKVFIIIYDSKFVQINSADNIFLLDVNESISDNYLYFHEVTENFNKEIIKNFLELNWVSDFYIDGQILDMILRSLSKDVFNIDSESDLDTCVGYILLCKRFNKEFKVISNIELIDEPRHKFISRFI